MTIHPPDEGEAEALVVVVARLDVRVVGRDGQRRAVQVPPRLALLAATGRHLGGAWRGGEGEGRGGINY